MLLVGTKVDLFERDGFETKSGRIVQVNDDFIMVKCKKEVYKLKRSQFKVEVRLTTRGNSLDQYRASY